MKNCYKWGFKIDFFGGARCPFGRPFSTKMYVKSVSCLFAKGGEIRNY